MRTLIEHRREDYAAEQYEQPNDAFWHVVEFSEYCSLCRVDSERLDRLDCVNP